MSTFNRTENTTYVAKEFQTKSGYIRRMSWVNPAPGSIDAPGSVHGAITLPASGTLLVTTGITQPDVTRTLTMKGSAGGMSGFVIVTGKDIRGKVITESMLINGTDEFTGLKAFKTITSILVPARTAPGNTVSLALGAGFGLDRLLTEDTLFLKLQNGHGANHALIFDANDISLNVVNMEQSPDGSTSYSVSFVTTEIRA